MINIYLYVQCSLVCQWIHLREYSAVWFHSGFVLWTEPCECRYLSHTPGGCVDFSNIARALRVLFTHRREDWADDKIASIIDELTSKLLACILLFMSITRCLLPYKIIVFHPRECMSDAKSLMCPQLFHGIHVNLLRVSFRGGEFGSWSPP